MITNVYDVILLMFRLLLPFYLQNRMRAIAEIVNALISGVKAGRDVDLNAIKRDINAKYALSRAPKLVEIIAALPEEHRAELLPQ